MLRWSVYVSILVYVVATSSVDSAIVSTTLDPETERKLLLIFGRPTASPTTLSRGKEPVEATTKFSLKPADVDHSHGNDSIKCTREDKLEGICVKKFLCDPDTGRVPKDSPLKPRKPDNGCPHYLYVCCLPAGAQPAPPTPPVREEKMPCGYSNAGANAFRITSDGSTAQYAEYPWTVALLKAGSVAKWNDRYIGGGSLIHPRVVLTVAAKVVEIEQPRDIICRAGEWDFQTTEEQYPYQDIEVEQIYWHDGYFEAKSYNNLALLFLKSPVIINKDTPHLAVACLGRSVPPPGTVCESMGWGKLKFEETQYSAILKKVKVPVVGHAPCQTSLSTYLGSRYTLRDDMFLCAGGEAGIDTCTGDGGAPLVCKIGDESSARYAVYGVVAWGLGCGLDDVPGVYMKVPSYIDWIKQKMDAEKLDTTYFEYE